MRHTRDSFLRFLKDNLPPTVPVHNVRLDQSAPDSDKLQMNAVNVTFLDVNPSVQVGFTQVEIAVIHDDELTALDWVKQVFLLLSAAYFTPRYDYTNPNVPVATGSNIFWDTATDFRQVFGGFYADYRCTLTLRHVVS